MTRQPTMVEEQDHMAQQLAIVEATDLDEDERQMMRDPVEVEQKIAGKEKLIFKLQEADRERHAALDAETVAFANGLHVHRAAIVHARESLKAQRAQVHENAEQALYRQRTDRHQTDTKLEQQAGIFAADIGACIEEDKSLQALADGYTLEVQAEVCHLYNDLTQARNLRLQQGRKLAEGVGAKLEEVRDAVIAEKRFRQDSESTLLELFGQMGQRLEQELEQARADRHAAAERMVSVMEAASDLLHKSQKAGATTCRDHIEVASESKKMASLAAELSKSRHCIQQGLNKTILQGIAMERIR